MQVPTSQLVSEYQLYTKDASAANVALGKQRMAVHYTNILSYAESYVVERTKYGSAKAGQRSYLLPPDYIKMKSVRFYDGAKWHSPEEIKNLERWHELTSVVHSVSIPDYWFVINEQGNMHLELEGVPVAEGTNNIEIVYEGFQDRLLFPADYVTGTVVMTNGSQTVTGSGTTFTSAMAGRFIRPTDGKYWYDIKAYNSATNLTLVNYFQETTLSGAGFVIAEIPRVPPEYGYTILWGACRDYWITRDTAMYNRFEKLYLADVASLRQRYKAKTKGAVTKGRPVNYRAPSVPRNYPSGLIG